MNSVRNWIRNYLAQQTKLPPEEISFDKTLGDYGLDSIDAVLMAGELEVAFGVEINPASFLQFDSFEDMICSLETVVEQETSPAPQ